jgi:hypothetical protein
VDKSTWKKQKIKKNVRAGLKKYYLSKEEND